MECPNCGNYMKYQKKSPVSSPWYCPKCKDYTLVKKPFWETIDLEQSLEKQKELQLMMQAQNLKAQQEQIALQQQQLQIQQAQFNAMLKCPKCGSTSITGQKKGFGVVKGGLGAAAGLATGGLAIAAIGAGAGNIGRKKVLCTCMNCGYRFKAGKK